MNPLQHAGAPMTSTKKTKAKAKKSTGVKRARNQSAASLAKQLKSCADTKAKNKKEKEEEKAREAEEKKRQKEETIRNKKANFFNGRIRTNTSVIDTHTEGNSSTCDGVTVRAIGNNNDNNNNDIMNVDLGESNTRNDNDINTAAETTADNNNNEKEVEDAVVEGSLVVNNAAPESITPYDVIANLDYDEGEDAGKTDADDPPTEKCGVMYICTKAVMERLQKEVRGDFNGETWLLDILRDNDWWLKTYHVPDITKKLQLVKEYDAYYRDIYVWLPDVRWKDPAKTFMPCCPNCKCNTNVGPHGFRDNHFGRQVVGMTSTYYVMSRRYICHECRCNVVKAKEDVEKVAQQNGLSIEVESVESESVFMTYTFMAYDRRILHLFKYNRGVLKFPAYLTWRAGVDKLVLKLLRPLQDMQAVVFRGYPICYSSCIQTSTKISASSMSMQYLSSENQF